VPDQGGREGSRPTHSGLPHARWIIVVPRARVDVAGTSYGKPSRTAGRLCLLPIK
jgi:hypothetical protein